MRTVEQIEADIAKTRSRLMHILEQLQDEAQPAAIAERTVGKVRSFVAQTNEKVRRKLH